MKTNYILKTEPYLNVSDCTCQSPFPEHVEFWTLTTLKWKSLGFTNSFTPMWLFPNNGNLWRQFKILKRMSWPNPPHMWKAVRTGTINKVLRLWQLVTASAQISFEIDPKTTKDGKINPHLPHWIFPSCGALHEPSLSSWFFSDFVCSFFSLPNSWLPPVVVSEISVPFLLWVLSLAFFPSLKSPLCPFLQWISGQMSR